MPVTGVQANNAGVEDELRICMSFAELKGGSDELSLFERRASFFSDSFSSLRRRCSVSDCDRKLEGEIVNLSQIVEGRVIRGRVEAKY